MQRLCALAIFVLCFLLISPADAKTKRRGSKPAREASRARLAEPQYDAATVNNPALQDVVKGEMRGPAVFRAQVLLDRANFSPGEIDGATGGNFFRAVSAFRGSRGLSPDPVVDAATWQALNVDTAPVLTPYKVTAEDVKGPFRKIPEDMMEQAKLPALSYESPEEAIAERFHCSPKMLALLNPGLKLASGTDILVPNVITQVPLKAARVEVSKSRSVVEVFDQEGKLISQYPASSGSEHDPLPIGEWKINGVGKNPKFNYNPKLFWDADPSHSKATIPPGPNGPVGVVWIDLSKEHYGIHGTPEPSRIGYSQSHGCIRLTNWDAMELADLVSPGIPAILKE